MYKVFPNAFIIDIKTVIIYDDDDDDQDLKDYTNVTVTYIAPDGTRTPWTVGHVIPIWDDPKSVGKKVIALIIEVTPRLPLPGCFGRFFSFFWKGSKNIGGTGTVSGSLNKDTTRGHAATAGDTKNFEVVNPILVFPVQV